MNIYDLVPLLIIVGSIIYSIMKSTKSTDKEKEKTLPEDEYWNLPQEEPAKIEEVVINPMIQTERKEQKKKKKVISHSFHIPREKTQLHTSPNIKVDEEIESMPPVFNIQDTDELKKAFIYSEILNRKDF